MSENKTGAAAFTLAEVLISVIVMLLTLGLLLSVFVSSKRSVVLAQTRLMALQLASSAAEQIRTNAYTNIGASTATSTMALIQYTLSNSVSTNFNKCKDIKITVRWIDPASTRSQVLTNYLAVCNTN